MSNASTKRTPSRAPKARTSTPAAVPAAPAAPPRAVLEEVSARVAAVDTGNGEDHPALHELRSAHEAGIRDNCADLIAHLRQGEIAAYTAGAFAGAVGDSAKRAKLYRIAGQLETLRREVAS